MFGPLLNAERVVAARGIGSSPAPKAVLATPNVPQPIPLRRTLRVVRIQPVIHRIPTDVVHLVLVRRAPEQWWMGRVRRKIERNDVAMADERHRGFHAF